MSADAQTAVGFSDPALLSDPYDFYATQRLTAPVVLAQGPGNNSIWSPAMQRLKRPPSAQPISPAKWAIC
jgi:hypothetical protein